MAGRGDTDLRSAESTADLLLYDGVCGLCHGLVQFLIARDRHDALCFAPLQGPTAAAILARHGRRADDLDTVYLVHRPGSPDERLDDRALAVLHALAHLGPVYRAVSSFFGLFPRAVLNFAYRCVARSRYQLWGRYSTCPVPTPAQRTKFRD